MTRPWQLWECFERESEAEETQLEDVTNFYSANLWLSIRMPANLVRRLNASSVGS